MNNDKIQQSFIETVQKIVRVELQNLNLLQGQWHLGVVDSVVNTKSLNVKIDGSNTSQKVACNPSITFSPGDAVWVIYINGDSKDKFVISKRGI